MTSDYDIAEVGDGLEVRGVSRSELTEALDLLHGLRALGGEITDAPPPLEIVLAPGDPAGRVHRGFWAELLEILNLVRTVQAEHVDATRDELLRALMGRHIALTPLASLNQARRLATHRNGLLATPFHTYETLRQLRGDKLESNTRTWVTRRRDAHNLFTVTHNGRTLIPQFQFDDHGKPRAELQPILAALDEGGVREWSLWTWLTAPTSFLSGEVPEQVARTNPARALRAAQRFAAGVVA